MKPANSGPVSVFQSRIDMNNVHVQADFFFDSMSECKV